MVIVEDRRNVAALKRRHLRRPNVLLGRIVIEARARCVCLAEFVDPVGEFMAPSNKTCLVRDIGGDGRRDRPCIRKGSLRDLLFLRVTIGRNLLCQALHHVLNALFDLIELLAVGDLIGTWGPYGRASGSHSRYCRRSLPILCISLLLLSHVLLLLLLSHVLLWNLLIDILQ